MAEFCKDCFKKYLLSSEDRERIKDENIVMFPTKYALDFSQVGANIQKQLDAKGFTQQRLADILGISKQVMNKIIKGNKAINVNELAKIASALGTTTDELLTVSGEPTSVDSLSFIGSVTCEETREKINLMRQAIDEIHMLEDLLNA